METLGEERVRVKFNVTNNSIVDHFKKQSASLINDLEARKKDESTSQEQLRLISIAQTKYEEAAMWAVKAVTI